MWDRRSYKWKRVDTSMFGCIDRVRTLLTFQFDIAVGQNSLKMASNL